MSRDDQSPEASALPSPSLQAPDMLVIWGLAALWSALGVVLLPESERAGSAYWASAIGGGIALGFGTGGFFVWWRRRSVPALAREAIGWAVLAMGLLLAFAFGLVEQLLATPVPGEPEVAMRGLGAGTLALVGIAAIIASFNLGWRLTPLAAVGRFGGVTAIAFAAWELIQRLHW